jgi:phosphoenolpyruvate-protein phosphotransferase (PTS system enzyme I)
MRKMKGNGLAPGIAIGKAVPLRPASLEFARRAIVKDEVDAEITRFREAAQAAADDIARLLDSLYGSGPERDILEAQQMILQDPDLDAKVADAVKRQRIAAECAVWDIFEELTEFFRNAQDEYLSQRAGDYRETGHRLLHKLMGSDDGYPLTLEPDSVLVMEDVPAILVIRYARQGLVGIVSERGSRTGHSAIVSRALGIPYVSGFPNLMLDAPHDISIVLDGEVGECVIDPDESTLSFYRTLRTQLNKRMENLSQLVSLETRTRDGVHVHLRCNIGFPAEIDQVVKLNAEGVGLFRTEFLFMDRDTAPDEEEQYRIYREVAEKGAPHEVVIRTIDVGGDKFSRLLQLQPEANPALGARGLRLSLKFPEVFRIQARAILRAGAYGNVNMMFPMVTALDELRQARHIITECKLELRREGLEFNPDVPTGVMIETPAAALISDALAAEADFFSIGANDLTQYALAVDRNSENIPELYDPHHPAVLHLITLIVQNARKHNIPVSVCGEIAAERDFIPFLVGLGIPELSVAPAAYLATKEWIMKLHSEHLVDLVLDLLEKATSHEVLKVIAQWRKKNGLEI